MEELIIFDPALTRADRLVLEELAQDIRHDSRHHGFEAAATSRASPEKAAKRATNGRTTSRANGQQASSTLAALKALNDPQSADFEPAVFNTVDLIDLDLPKAVDQWLLRPYIHLAGKVIRHKTDVVMITHLLLYSVTTLPSVVVLFRNFTPLHGVLHFVMQVWFMGAYTIMMHQHIHQRGILRKELALLDRLFPYVLDPLMGHTWNSYFYHHVKHHHVEGNGPNDLSSTIRYQRDSLPHFLHYYLRFFLGAWCELPLYFYRTKRYGYAVKAAFWEWSSYLFFYLCWTRLSAGATFFAMVLPFLLLRAGLMLGNWGQHAFVDDEDPDSDYRSSITLIDATSNRHCFNDGYHTSHHLNPLRHWREHPGAFLRDKTVYAAEDALVFHNIDFIMIAVHLLRKDYARIARCLVPMGPAQTAMTMDEREAMLRRHTRAFGDDEVRRKFPKA